jgi:hypothetical protein
MPLLMRRLEPFYLLVIVNENECSGTEINEADAEEWSISANSTMCSFTKITSTGRTFNRAARSGSKNEYPEFHARLPSPATQR